MSVFFIFLFCPFKPAILLNINFLSISLIAKQQLLITNSKILISRINLSLNTAVENDRTYIYTYKWCHAYCNNSQVDFSVVVQYLERKIVTNMNICYLKARIGYYNLIL